MILPIIMFIFAILGMIAIISLKKYFINKNDNYFDITYTLAIFISTSLFWSFIGLIINLLI